jgi:Protein of unknown function (DUF3224)
MSTTARGTFDINLAPGPAELDGAVSRFEFTKTFKGDLEGTGAGVMLSAGDAGRGSAGYVAVETVRGRLGDREGGFALQQFGTVLGGSPPAGPRVPRPTKRRRLSDGSGRIRYRASSACARTEITYITYRPRPPFCLPWRESADTARDFKVPNMSVDVITVRA